MDVHRGIDPELVTVRGPGCVVALAEDTVMGAAINARMGRMAGPCLLYTSDAADEGFAVAWYYWNGDVYGQAFSTTDANGNPVSGTPQKVGDEIVANDEHLSGTQNEQTISRLDDGGFLISWADHDGSGGDRGGSSTDIYARRFDANGEPQQFSLSVDATGAGALNATQVFSGGDALGVRGLTAKPGTMPFTAATATTFSRAGLVTTSSAVAAAATRWLAMLATTF